MYIQCVKLYQSKMSLFEHAIIVSDRIKGSNRACTAHIQYIKSEFKKKLTKGRFTIAAKRQSAI